MDLLFYGIAVYEGYRFSINSISEEALLTLTYAEFDRGAEMKDPGNLLEGSGKKDGT